MKTIPSHHRIGQKLKSLHHDHEGRIATIVNIRDYVGGNHTGHPGYVLKIDLPELTEQDA